MRAIYRGQGPLLQALDVMVGFVGARLARDQSFLWEAAMRATNRGQGPLLQALNVTVGFVGARLARDRSRPRAAPTKTHVARKARSYLTIPGSPKPRLSFPPTAPDPHDSQHLASPPAPYSTYGY